MIDQELLEQFELLAAMIQGIDASLREEIQKSETSLREEIRQSEVRTKVYIENNVTKRLDSLYGGFQLNRGKIGALEQQQQDMDEDFGGGKTRVSILENKTA